MYSIHPASASVENICNAYPEYQKLSGEEIARLIYRAIPEYRADYNKDELEQFIFVLKQEYCNYNNISCEDIDCFKYRLFSRLVEFNDSTRNESAKAVLRALFIEHPNADKSPENLLDLVMESGWNLEIVKFLKEFHPAWNQLSPDHFVRAIRELCNSASYPGFVDEKLFETQRMAGSKEVLFFLMQEVPLADWQPRHIAEIVSLMISVRYPFIQFTPDEKPYECFLTCDAWNQMNYAMVAKILESAAKFVNPENTLDLFVKLQFHPGYLALPEVLFSDIAQKVMHNIEWMRNHNPYRRDMRWEKEEFISQAVIDKMRNLLAEHPKWKKV